MPNNTTTKKSEPVVAPIKEEVSAESQRRMLHSNLWKIANDVRGAVDGWDFKQYVLGTLFYRFLCENFCEYVEGGDASINYASKKDTDPEIENFKEIAIEEKGFFIYPSQLFSNVIKTVDSDKDLNITIKNIFDSIEKSAIGAKSEASLKGLFADFDTTSTRLGNTVKDKNERLAKVLKGVASLDFGIGESQIDLFGDAYEFLISNYAANAGKSGGEFFTPQQVSKLIAKIAMADQKTVNKIYDPACGSGSLLLQAKKQFKGKSSGDGFFGQELNHTTYNLARMNMFLHDINYSNFKIALGDTLKDPAFAEDKPFDVIVSNPPYSVTWEGDNNPLLINDQRFSPAGVLAPKSKADFAFVMHILSYLSPKGRAAVVCFPGIFYRGGAEQKIRKYLIENNYVESVIALAPNLFFGTSISVTILVLSKCKKNTDTQFIDATGIYKKETNNNILTEEQLSEILELFKTKKDKAHFCKMVPKEDIEKNDYNLSVSSYVETKDTSEVIDIDRLNEEVSKTVNKIDLLRANISKIVAEIESAKKGE